MPNETQGNTILSSIHDKFYQRKQTYMLPRVVNTQRSFLPQGLSMG